MRLPTYLFTCLLLAACTLLPKPTPVTVYITTTPYYLTATAAPTASPTPTLSSKPGGPDDASVLQLAAMSRWPSALAEIPKMRAS